MRRGSDETIKTSSSSRASYGSGELELMSDGCRHQDDVIVLVGPVTLAGIQSGGVVVGAERCLSTAAKSGGWPTTLSAETNNNYMIDIDATMTTDSDWRRRQHGPAQDSHSTIGYKTENTE